jgi:hypothetical protein
MSGERNAEQILAELGEAQLRKDANKPAKVGDITAALKAVAQLMREVVDPLEARIASLASRVAQLEGEQQQGDGE